MHCSHTSSPPNCSHEKAKADWHYQKKVPWELRMAPQAAASSSSQAAASSSPQAAKLETKEEEEEEDGFGGVPGGEEEPRSPEAESDGPVHFGRKGEAAHEELTEEEIQKKAMAQKRYRDGTHKYRHREGHKLGWRVGNRGGARKWWFELRAKATRENWLPEFYNLYPEGGKMAKPPVEGPPAEIVEQPRQESRRRLVS